MDDIRVGLVGYGPAGRFFHAPLIHDTPGLRLAAVVTRDPGRAEEAGSRYDVPALPRAEDLFGRCDLVVVASPNRTHVPIAEAALSAGLPVVVDKPLSATSVEARRLVALAEERGLMLTVFQNRRWDGDFLTLRHLLAKGALGEVARFESRFERWRPEPKGGWRESGGAEDVGGLLYDLGSHLVDQALRLFGPARTVYAEIDSRRPGVASDDDTFLALAHAGGVRSHLWMSAVTGRLGPRLRVLGSAGAYVKEGLDVQEDLLRAGVAPGTPGFGEEAEDRWGLLGTDEAAGRVRTEPGAYLDFYRGVERSLREGAPPPVDPADAVETTRVLEAALLSAEQGTVTHLR
ncbi:Gfo/Idh/MocA family protein [Nonomuraea longicatena]|uniref:Gfo/Idh/MocA family oxidoreductase n=1 Tax=Nonomuraea longicatena TaxID=83682 RepID=A0ABN1NML0_9ACTN